MSNRLLIEPHYLGSLEFFILLTQFEEITLEVNQHFSKQTYKNRCYILSSQGKLPLTVPVKFSNRTIFKDAKIDHSQSWQKDHWGAFYSTYGKSPFFEYFSDSFKVVWDKNHKYLLDLNLDFMTLCLDLLQIDKSFSFTEMYQPQAINGVRDVREVIHPKLSFEGREFYTPHEYIQNFGNDFVPNLSILDLLFCEGTGASQVLKKSVFSHIEHL